MSKAAIIGTGAVGTTIACAVMMRGLMRELVLVDQQAEKAKAEVTDLNHGALEELAAFQRSAEVVRSVIKQVGF